MRRLGLDIGTNSIGWCLTEDDSRIVDVGVRIYSDGREPSKNSNVGAPLAERRRLARGARRRRDRYLRRRSAFLKALVNYGLMPADVEEAKLIAGRDPYPLRDRSLSERLEPIEIGRALFHLNQRRGFRSNRKAERKSKAGEEGKIASGGRALDQAMTEQGTETLGQFLASRDTKRVRLNSENQEYDFYPQRHHIEDEFEKIWKAQAKYHPTLLTDTSHDALHRILFFQRPLKDQPIGYCTFAGLSGVPANETRLPKAHPLFQERRLYEEVNQLRIVSVGAADRELTRDERDTLILKLRDRKRLSFESLAKLIKLDAGQRFNKESETRTDLVGDEVRSELGDKKRFGPRWLHFPLEEQVRIIDRLQNEEEPDILLDWLKSNYRLSDTSAEAVANARLPEGYGRFGATATRRILKALKDNVITYDKAAQAAGFHHSDHRTGEVLDRLPYYGEVLTHEIAPGSEKYGDPLEQRWGKITNPTVHIGLRQLEKLVNAIIAVYGKPDSIVVELARELKLGEKEREKHRNRIKKDYFEAQRRSRILTSRDADDNQTGKPIAPDTGANRALLKLWEELAPGHFLDRNCPYCGKPINITTLFSEAVQVDHILPYSQTLDDSPSNKIVAHRACNQQKGNRPPYLAWSGNSERWAVITEQLKYLHKSKQWRFAPDAMERFAQDGGFLARQLKDTQYISRIAGKYLRSLYATKDEGRVDVIPGRMTAMLRRLWGLNSLLPDHNFVENEHSNAPKNRLDHRHHAIDAAVAAVTTLPQMQAIAKAAGRAEDQGLDRLLEDLPQPWERFREDLGDKLSRIIVSHKPDHGRTRRPYPGRDVTAGRLHNETAYGLTGAVAADGKTPIVVHRVPLTSLKPGDLTDPIRIPDAPLRDALSRATRGKSGKEFEQALLRFAKEHPTFNGIRHVRVREALSVIAIRDRQGHAYKAYKGDSNARWEFWGLPDGSFKTVVVTMFCAHQPGADTRPHPAAKRLLNLRQNDLIAIERNGGMREIVRVAGFNVAGRLTLAAANESGNLKERDGLSNEQDPFKYIYLQGRSIVNAKARQVRVDPLGRVFDPGPRQ